MNEQELQAYLGAANVAYRAGTPTLSDNDYDGMMEDGRELFPDNPWFNQQEVEPEAVAGKTVPLPARMLSTNKAYSIKEIEKWANDVLAVGRQMRMGESEVFFMVTPKLDGFAAYDDGEKLYTRGDGRSGTDISRAIDNGLSVDGRGKGPGEIVVDKFYFEQHLAHLYDNSRNIIAGVIKEGDLDVEIKDAIIHGAVCFQPFAGIGLERQTVTKNILLFGIETLFDTMQRNCIFDTDGLVIEAIHPAIKEEMGATNHHHRWQIAYKKNTEYHNIRVTGLVWQTSKNGRLTPVVQLEPTKVSGVTISKATGHNYGNVVKSGIERGAIVRVCRSGLVIPYIESVVKRAPMGALSPAQCLSCGEDTIVDGDNLLCTNTETCPAQIEGAIEFFFKTLGSCDGFGPKVIEKLVGEGVDTVLEVYRCDEYIFEDHGFREKTALNLATELAISRQRPTEDWRFLAAFSIHNVGKGGCEKLLKHHRLADVFNLKIDEIMRIDGFAVKTASSLVNSLANIKPQLDAWMKLGFNLTETPIGVTVVGNLSGKTVVFTGSMQKGGRSDMEKQAKFLGAKVGSSVSSKTDYLICGADVGAAKTTAAKRHGVTVLTEDQYLEMAG